MGLFSRLQCEEDLAKACRSVGSAAGAVAVGQMPHDFLVQVVEYHQEKLPLLFAEARQQKGERKAMKIACDTVAIWVGAPLDARNLPSRQAKQDAKELIRRLCVGAA